MDKNQKLIPPNQGSSQRHSKTNIATEQSEAFLSPMSSVKQFNLNDSGSDSDNDEFVSAKGSFAAPKLRSIQGFGK